MAAPSIQGITPSGPVTVPPGGAVSFVVAATDADARTETWQVEVTDAAGHKSQPAALTLVFPDPLQVIVAPPVGSRGTVAVDPVNPLRFTVTSTN